MAVGGVPGNQKTYWIRHWTPVCRCPPVCVLGCNATACLYVIGLAAYYSVKTFQTSNRFREQAKMFQANSTSRDDATHCVLLFVWNTLRVSLTVLTTISLSQYPINLVLSTFQWEGCIKRISLSSTDPKFP